MASYIRLVLASFEGSVSSYSLAINAYTPATETVQLAGFQMEQRPTGEFFERALLWTSVDAQLSTGDPDDLSTYFASDSSQALGLNNQYPSIVVGWYKAPSAADHSPIKWEKAGATPLGTLGGQAGEARDVNDAGAIVGWAHNVGGNKRAFLWTPNGAAGPATNPRMEDLGTLGGAESEAWGVNNGGQVVGIAQTANGDRHAFVWTPGGADGVPGNPQMKDIHQDGFIESTAFDINDQGHVAGELHGPLWQAFYWSAQTGTQQLPNLGYAASASSINNFDQIVGYARPVGTGPWYGVIWNDHVIADLNSLLGTEKYYFITDGNSINDHGDIACSGRLISGGATYGIVLSPQTQPQPIPPPPRPGPGPAGSGWPSALAETARYAELLKYLAMAESARRIRDPQNRYRIAQLALQCAEKDIARLVKELDDRHENKQYAPLDIPAARSAVPKRGGKGRSAAASETLRKSSRILPARTGLGGPVRPED